MKLHFSKEEHKELLRVVNQEITKLTQVVNSKQYFEKGELAGIKGQLDILIGISLKLVPVRIEEV